MKFYLFYFSLLLSRIFLTKQIVPNWNLNKSSVNLLSSEDSIKYIEFEQTKDNLNVTLYKNIIKEDGSIKYKTNIRIIYERVIVYNGEINFDQIDSIYHFGNENIICPRGKYHPYYFYDQTYSTLPVSNLENFQENGDWELKCYLHSVGSVGFFLTFYLMNGQAQLYYQNLIDGSWKRYSFHNEIYDIKLVSEDINTYEYSLIYLVNNGHIIDLVGGTMTVNDGSISISEKGGHNYIMLAKNLTRGCFENTNDHFYYLTYTNISYFSCGYFNENKTINSSNVLDYKISNYSESPLEFNEEVEIEDFKFIKHYKYAYYVIKNKSNGKKNYGIIDTTKNLVVFNTEEELLTFVPYTNISMLAITANASYEVCIIKENNKCIDSYDCNQTNYNYILNSEGNKCANECEEGKVLFIKNNFCIDSCNESIYVIEDNKCGLCKDFHPDKPYKIIDSNVCLSQSEIPGNIYIYDDKLFLLKCEDGYKPEVDKCVLDCYFACETCWEKSEDENNQKCLSCKPNYMLEGENCIDMFITTPTTIITSIPTTAFTTITTTIPITETSIISSTMVNTIQTTIVTNPISTPEIIMTTIQNTLNSITDFPNDEISVIEINDDDKNENKTLASNSTENQVCSTDEIVNGNCTQGKMNLSDIENLKDYLKNKMMEDDGNDIRKIKTGNVIIQYSTLDEQKEDTEASNIDLGDCEQILKNNNGLAENDSLIIYKVDIKNSDSTSTYVQYEVLNPYTMASLDLRVCDDVEITIDTPVDIGNKIEELYDSLSESGYNLFDSEDSFYQDICTTYTSANGTDMLLSDRKNDIFSSSQNLSLCQTGCKLASYNSETKKARCNCNIDDSGSSGVMNLDIDSFFDKEQIKDSFYDTISNSNFRVLKCYKSVFSPKIIQNIGGLFMSVITVLFLGFNILSFITYQKKIHSFIINISNLPAFDYNIKTENKTNIKDSQVKNDNTKNNENSNNGINQDSKLNKKGKKRTTKNKNLIYFPPKKILIPTKKNIKTEKNKAQINEIEFKNQFFIYSNDTKNNVMTEGIIIEDIKYDDMDIDISNLNDQEINDLPYEIAVRADKRSYWQYYWSLLKKKQLILFTFWPANDYNVYVIKVSLFLISFGLYFTINGFFFTDDTMHKLYIDEGVYNLIFQIPQILFSTIISTIISMLLKMLSLTEKNILEVKQEKDSIKKMEKMKTIEKSLKIKFLLYFIISTLLMLFFWYFISCFCSVYKNTQIVLIKDTLLSYILSMVYPFGLNLLPGLLRIPALRAEKKDRKCLYKISQYVALI